jgi:hypothetical protein
MSRARKSPRIFYMDLNSYAASVDQIVDLLLRHFPQDTMLSLSLGQSNLAGLFKTQLTGYHERSGYRLDVRYEVMEVLLDGTFRKSFRYQITRAGHDIIRLQTDRHGHPPNAHFPPHFEREHFTIANWPPHLQDMNFPVMYQFFLDVVRAGGQLPAEFRNARP